MKKALTEFGGGSIPRPSLIYKPNPHKTMPHKTFRFLHTWEIEAFRKAHPLGEMQIVRNPKTGKHFFVFEGIRGAVSRNYPTEPLGIPSSRRYSTAKPERPSFCSTTNRKIALKSRSNFFKPQSSITYLWNPLPLRQPNRCFPRSMRLC